MSFSAISFVALAVQTTFNKCEENEDAFYYGPCRNIWYKMCDKYTIEPSGTCNLETFGDVSVEWFSTSVEVWFWDYVEKNVEAEE